MRHMTLVLGAAALCAATASGQVITGDANLDDLVDLKDFGILKDNFGATGATWAMGDFNANELVDLEDFSLLKAHFGQGAGAPAVGAITDPDSGALQLTLTIDYWTGAATLTNVTASPLDVDGYEIWSAGGHLDPVGWDSIADVEVSGDPRILIIIPPGWPLSFGELTATPSVLAEGSLSGYAQFPVGAPFSIGNPILPGAASETDLSFYYKLYGEPGGDKWLGEIVIIPEPATVAVLLAGTPALLRRRRR